MTFNKAMHFGTSWGLTTVTWNTSDAGSAITFNNGDLEAVKTSGGAWSTVRATLAKSTGKRYYEIKFNSASIEATAVGCAITGGTLNNTFGGLGVDSFGYDRTAVEVQEGSFSIEAGALNPAVVSGDVIGFAIDLDAGKLWESLNGVYTAFRAGANPATGASPSSIFTPNLTVYPAGSLLYTGLTLNLLLAASGTFANSPPSGFVAWNT